MNEKLRAKALRGMVKVRHAPRNWGTGFLAGGSYLITAAHCLPRLPAAVYHFPGDDRVAVQVRGLAGGPNATALVAVAESCSDLAVLSDWGSGGELAEEPSGKLQRRFDVLVGGLEALPLRLGDLPLNEGVRVHVYTSRGQWVSGKALSPCSHSLHVGFAGEIPGGTSGGPVFDDDGRVVGAISTAGGPAGLPHCDAEVVRLPNALPVWLLNMLEGDG